MNNKYGECCNCPARGQGLFREVGNYETPSLFYAKMYKESGAKSIYKFNEMLDETDIKQQRKDLEKDVKCIPKGNNIFFIDSTNFHKHFENKYFENK